MPDSQIYIQRMIVHKIDHKKYEEPQFSDIESPIPEEVCNFLTRHISSNRENKYTRNAKFIAPLEGETVAKDIFDRLLSNQNGFIEYSKIIADHLFQKMRRSKTISPGDLVICEFSEDDINSRSLALLKLDPKDGFIGEREEINGQMRVVLRQVKGVLPSGDLQKCAFIIPQDKRETKGYDLKVLDQQAAKYGAQRLVASFFVKDFLQCKVGLNSADTTRIFVYGSLEWVDTKEWPEENKCQFRTRIKEAIQFNVVDTTSIAQSIIPTPEEQDDYLDFLKEGKGIEDLAFEPDPEERQKLTRYAWFEGDQDLQIRINDDAIGPGKMLEYHKDEATNTWIIKITTTQWDEVIKRGR